MLHGRKRQVEQAKSRYPCGDHQSTDALLGMRDPHQAEYTLCEGGEENRDIGATAKGYHRLQQQQNRL